MATKNIIYEVESTKATFINNINKIDTCLSIKGIITRGYLSNPKKAFHTITNVQLHLEIGAEIGT